METFTLTGTSPSGETLRRLDARLYSNGQLALWIHSPGSETNGWEIQVSACELVQALSRLNVRPSGGASAE